MLRDIKVSTREGSAFVRYEDEVDPHLDRNAALRGNSQKSDWGKHVASIPNIIALKWLNEEWNRGHDLKLFSKEWMEFVARKLRDPEWAYLRTDGPVNQIGWGD